MKGGIRGPSSRRVVTLWSVSLSFTLGVALQTCSGIDPYLSAICSSSALFAAVIVILNTGRWNGVLVRSEIILIFLLLGVIRSSCAQICSWYEPSLFPDSIPGRITLSEAALLKKFSGFIGTAGFDNGCEALLRALLTGQKDHLSPETVRAFRNAGASHILALSGMHLGIIYAIIKMMLRPLGGFKAAKRAGSAACVAISLVYTAAVGSGPSITRAFIFICLREIGGLSPGRKRDGKSIWLCSLFIQLCLTPEVITSAGFQLSYLAMAGITFLLPVLNKWYPETPAKDPVRKLWSLCALSISCQVFTAPLSYLLFGSFPVYFLICNLVALPLTEALMVCGLTATCLNAAGLEAVAPLTEISNRLASLISSCMDIISTM